MSLLNLHVLDEFVGSSDILKVTETSLGNNGAKFAAGSRNTMSGGTVPCRKNFSRNNKGCCVGTKVLEEVSQTVEEDKGLCRRRVGVQLVKAES